MSSTKTRQTMNGTPSVRRRGSISVIAGIALLVSPALSACLYTQVLGRVLSQPSEPRRVAHKIENPVRSDARLAVLWVGHSTVLIQIDDRFILTDPVFTRSVGVFSPRLVEPGILPEHLPPKMVVAVSHSHFDHLSYDSLETLAAKIELLVLPAQALAYLPRYDFPAHGLGRWESSDAAGVRVTAVPVRHVGGRYRFDNALYPDAFTGYVFEYHGISVYFAGDTVFDARVFGATRSRFGALDLALLPICPAEPSTIRRAHMNPEQSLDAFELLGAKRMVPIHYDTFINSADRVGDCSLRLLSEMSARNVFEDRVTILKVGEQRVIVANR